MKKSKRNNSKYSKKFLKYYSFYQLCFSLISFLALLNIFSLVIGFIEGNLITTVNFYFLNNSFLWKMMSFSHYQFFATFGIVNFLTRIMEAYTSTNFVSNPSFNVIAWYIISGLIGLGLSIMTFILINKGSEGKRKPLIAFLIFYGLDSLFLIGNIAIGECIAGIFSQLGIHLFGWIIILLAYMLNKKMKSMKDEEKYNQEVSI